MDSGKNQEDQAQVVSSTGDESSSLGARHLPTFASLPKKFWFALALVLLIAGVCGAYYLHRAIPEASGPKITVKSETQVENQELQALQAATPANTASLEEKLKFYDKLFDAQTNVENYKAAVATFEKRQALSTSGLQYYDYFSAGQDYCKLKDKVSASKAFESVRAVLPPDNPETDFKRADVLNSIDFISKECEL
ncbi:MAG: hypothetical protein JWN82_644 [Candidatus Saccharibacteria bacterium]|nr:hypothetical protein [Candidatus Saccharibacteria bacterium]